MKLNIRGLLICIIILFLLSYFLDNMTWDRLSGGIDTLIAILDKMVDDMTIGKYKGNLEYTLIYIKGNNVIAFLVSALLYLTLFARKK